jgi:hypothetical protein
VLQARCVGQLGLVAKRNCGSALAGAKEPAARFGGAAWQEKGGPAAEGGRARRSLGRPGGASKAARAADGRGIQRRWREYSFGEAGGGRRGLGGLVCKIRKVQGLDCKEIVPTILGLK